MSIQRKEQFLFLISFMALALNGFSQPLPDSIVKRLDNLYSTWNKPNSPGCAVGIVRNDTLIFSKGYGMANLEYDVPITAKTIFYMCSVSKQFAGYSIVLLARQGKLNLDEDIRVYLPWMADFGKKITVRHLLNHTSGLRDDIGLATISGIGVDGMLTQDLGVSIIKRQRTLNFTPGEKYSYSNSNFVLLAEIVKTVSGKSFRSFTDSSIFKPLQMQETHFQDDYTELIRNRAVSYDRLDSNRFANNFQNVYTLGDGGLFTNITDMTKWVSNFYSPKAGDPKDILQLTEKGKLNDGSSLRYALGISVDSYNGWKTFSHSGGLAGYRTFINVFPDLKMGFLVFSNVGDFNSSAKANAMADIFVKDTAANSKQVQLVKRDSLAAMLKNESAFRRFTGDYLSENGLPLNLEIRNKKLYYKIYNQTNFLIQQTKDSFFIADEPDSKLVFSIDKADTIVDLTARGQFYHFKKYTNNRLLSDEKLRAYTGAYYSPELDCTYGITVRDRQLFLTSSKYNDIKITVTSDDNLITDWWVNHLHMLRDSRGKISGFEINSGSIMYLKFDRVTRD